MPEDGVKPLRHQDILTLEEIFEFSKIAVANGINKIRLTGGEPLVRKNIVHLVKLLSGIKGLDDLSLTTNGILLEEYAGPLAEAGLKRVNISLDTLDPDKFRKITRGGDITKVLTGITAAKEAGLIPIKINCVVDKSSSEPDAALVKEFCKNQNLQVRFIHQMNLETGEYAIVEGGTGGDCTSCNKLRLSSDGILRPCLFNDLSFNVRELGFEKAFVAAIKSKPQCGTNSLKNSFYTIGG
jgi:cyclic pyranopterin phosphate synthase